VPIRCSLEGFCRRRSTFVALGSWGAKSGARKIPEEDQHKEQAGRYPWITPASARPNDWLCALTNRAAQVKDPERGYRRRTYRILGSAKA
jgi:hypothetical protein